MNKKAIGVSIFGALIGCFALSFYYCGWVSYKIGREYESGKFGPQDYVVIFDLYSKSADLDYAPAQLALAFGHKTGHFGKDWIKTIYWATKAAKQYYTDAFMYLSHAYRFGIGVEKNRIKSLMWFYLAEVNGDLQAIAIKGVIYKRYTASEITAAKKMAMVWESENPK